MKLKKRKGFTLTELIIVIVIIGILAAVLVPSLASYIKKAKISSDVMLVKNLNIILATNEIEGKNNTMSEALKDAFDGGYSVEKITPTSSGDIVWDEVNDRFALTKDYKLLYGEEKTKKLIEKDKNNYKLWKIVNDIQELKELDYSIYLSGNTILGNIEIENGIDVGNNISTKIIYQQNKLNKDITICTNGGALEINAPNDTIHHYGYLQELKVENVSTSECYYEHGYIETLTSFTTGKFIMTKDAVFHDKQEEILQVLNQNEKVINVGEQYEVHHYGKDGVCTKPGCNAYNDTIHVHKWNEGEITTNPTCEYDGKKIYTCIECNTIRVEILSKLGHDLIYHEKLDSTCTTKGHTEYDTCSRCDYTTFKELSLLEHKPSDWIIDKDSTCLVDGSKHKECTVCHETLETEVINKLGHDLEHHDKLDSTCTTKGHTEYDTCSRCDYSNYEEIPSLGHKYSDWIIDKDPTCLTAGIKHKECTVCHETLETETIEKLGHNYIDGKCTNCGTKYGFSIDETKSYIYFGEYPQTVKKNDVNIVTTTPDSRGYYLGSDGEHYAKVTAKPYYVSSNPILYFSNDQAIERDTVYYFKVEPIKWNILNSSNGTYLLLSDLIIDNKEFYDSIFNRGNSTNIIYANNYEFSNIRKWLNEQFYDIAFTEELKSYIVTTEVNNGKETTAYQSVEYTDIQHYICNNTKDKVYLLSYNDLINSEYGFANYQARLKQTSDYAKALGTYVDVECNGKYWLRSPVLGSYSVNVVYTAGNAAPSIVINSAGINTDAVGVLPAITIQVPNFCDTHTKSDWIIDVEPTCLDKGSKHIECTICHKLLEEVEIEALGHNYVGGKCLNCGDRIYEIKNEYIYFGEYPQTLKESNVVLSKKTNEKGYYIGSDGEQYMEITATPYQYTYIYFNNKQQILENEKYYFKIEPIKWKILSSNNMCYYLMTDLIIDNKEFNSSTDVKITGNGKIIYAGNYMYSSIRKWLNNDFYNKAFTTEEQTYIQTSIVNNGLDSVGDISNSNLCNNTTDKVYLLNKKAILNGAATKKQLTDYAKARGCNMSIQNETYNNGGYWLRSPSSTECKAVYVVANNGEIRSEYATLKYYGVSPVITINLNSNCQNHIESDWIIDVEPTCLDKGSKHTECTICHKLLEEVEIEALGHNYVSGKCIRCDDSIFIIENGYIYFGEYPQSIKDDNVTIISDTLDSDGYYLGSDGERYAMVITQLHTSTIQYFNNKQQIVKGTTYYFKVEPIKWKILQVNGTEYKLVTDLIIDNQKFHSSTSTRTIDGKTIYPNNYEYSDIRKWLNEDFYNKAFTKVLQSYINTTLVDNSKNSIGFLNDTYTCNDTYDKVYLLSYKDITNTEYGFIDYTSREKQLTDYAKAKGCTMHTGVDYYNNGYYWLRSPHNGYGYEGYGAQHINPEGKFGGYDLSWGNNDDVGVSAAITISLR